MGYLRQLYDFELSRYVSAKAISVGRYFIHSSKSHLDEFKDDFDFVSCHGYKRGIE